MFNKVKEIWNWIQDFMSLKGGLFVDAFAVVFLIRLLAPLKGYAALTAPEAAMWAATITAFAASNIGGGPKVS